MRPLDIEPRRTRAECTNLEELHLANNRLYSSSDPDSTGIDALFDASGNLALPLKKIDLWGNTSGAFTKAGASACAHMNKLYALCKAGELELGYRYSYDGGAMLVEGRDYEVSCRNNLAAGTAVAVVAGRGAYGESAKATFTIDRAANPMKVSVNKKSINARTVTSWPYITRPLTVTNAKGTLKFTKASGSKRLALNKKTGQVTVKAGTPAGTYRVKVKVKAAGNVNYKSKTKTVKATVKVK